MRWQKRQRRFSKPRSLQVLADDGYYNSADLKACEDDGIEAYVPLPEGNGVLEKKGRFSLKDFSYDATADAYRCPAGELLRPTKGRLTNTSGRIEIRYLSRKAICDACPLRARCLAPKAAQRSIARWEHEDVIERHRARMQSADADELMRRRSAIVEHPFGTLKCRAGYRHFLRSRLQQGTRRMEPDGTLLQLHPRTQYPRVRALCRLHGSKGACCSPAVSYSRPAKHSVRSGGILDTNRVTDRSQLNPSLTSRLTQHSCPAWTG